MQNIWQKQKQKSQPFTVLAPMEDVTDIVFREMVSEVARPEVFVTEFVNVEGLFSEGQPFLIHRLKMEEKQKPLIAQVWGIYPENFEKAAKMIEEMGFDGIDINMGCPQKDVVKTGACSALIENEKLAKEIIEATKKGAPNLPVSVKTRIGFKKIKTKEWFTFLLQQDLAAITVHGRTQKEMSKVPAHWEEIAKVVKLRDEIAPQTVIIGNGDVKNYAEALEKHQQYQVDGVMIGRGIFTDISAFDKNPTKKDVTKEEKIALCAEHIKLYTKTWGTEKRFEVLKKFFKIYVNEFTGAKELRTLLMETKTPEEALEILKN